MARVKRPGAAKKEARARLARIESGDAVDVPCRLRRTSSRGWSPWVPGALRFPAGPVGAEFVADDPLAVGIISGRAGRSGPIPLVGPATVGTRPVRFKGEAFYGLDADIVVLDAERATTEVALPPAEVDPVAARLRAVVATAPTDAST